MEYTLNDILIKAGESIDMIYLIDTKEDSFVAMKNTDAFREIFGDKGSYTEFANRLHEYSLDRRVARDTPYGIFLDTHTKITQLTGKSAHVSWKDQDIYISVNTYPMDEDKFALFINNITEHDYREMNFANEERKVLDSAYLFTMDVDLVSDHCGSMAMSEINDLPASELELKFSEWRKMIQNMFHPQDREEFLKITSEEYLRENLTFDRANNSADFEMMNLDGKFIWVKLIFHRIKTLDENEFRFFFMVEDIHDSHTRLMEDMKKFEAMANHDQLTGLLNRVGIQTVMEERHERSLANAAPLSLLMFDIDHFKEVNDTYGHHEGDLVLKGITSAIRDGMNAHGGKVGRWGGEEFVGVFDGKSLEETKEIEEGIRKTIEDKTFEGVGKVTISIGAIVVNPSESETENLERLDSALYKAKNSGRNRVEVA